MAKPNAGFSLLGIVAVMSIALLLLLSLGQAMTFQHQFVVYDEDTEHAHNLAEGVIYKAIGELCRSEGFSGDLAWHLASDRPKNLGSITFTPSRPIPHSTNNLAGATARPGYGGRVVPPGTARLIGTGVFGRAKVELECLYYKPPFPRGVVASGPISLEGTQILGLTPEATYPGAWAQVPSRDRALSHVFSNAASARSLVIGAGSHVSGNAASQGQVLVEGDGSVGGEIQSYAAAQVVPDFPVQEMINRVSMVAGLHPFYPGQIVNDFMTRSGDLTIPGDLVVDGGTLAVSGSLTVTGAVRGRGVILVRDGVEVRGGAAFQADQQVAILAGGPITLRGAGQNYYFQGLLYSESRLSADRLTVLGSVICNSSNPADQLQLDNVQLITVPVHVTGRQGLPQLGRVSDDAFRFFLHSQADPLHPGEFLFYGKADYSENMAYGTEPVQMEVYFRPGEVVWMQRPRGSTGPFTETDRGPYDGSRSAFLAEMNRFAGFFGESGGPGNLAPYLNNLQSGNDSGQFLEINVNQVLRPLERSRILYWGPLLR